MFKIKRWPILLLAIVMIMSMVGCTSPSDNKEEGNTTTTPGSSSSPATEGPAKKLVIWTNLTAEAQAKVLQKQFSEVANEMNIDFEMVTISFNDMYAKLTTAAISGEVPDIMHTNFAGAAYLQSKGMIGGLDDVIDKIGRNDFISTYLRVLQVDGTTWGIPDWAMHTSVWYRKDLFEQKGLKIPTNWDEFKAVAKELCIDSNNDGNIDIYGFPIPLHAVQVAPQTFYEFLYSAGVYTFDPNTGEYVFGQQKEKATEVLDYMISLYKEVSPPSSIEWSWSEYRNALVEGTVAMTLDMGAVIGLAQSNNPDMVDKLGCFDFPGPDGNKHASFGSGYCFVASSQGSESMMNTRKDFLTRLYTHERAAERALSRPMFAFPSLYPALDIYRNHQSVALFQTEIDTISNAFENSKWYWYGMEYGLSQMSSQIEATTFFGEALQSVALGLQSPKDAVEYIDQQLQEQLAIIGK